MVAGTLVPHGTGSVQEKENEQNKKNKNAHTFHIPILR